MADARGGQRAVWKDRYVAYSETALQYGLVALIVTACGVVGALAIWWAVRGTRLAFLFERPDWCRLTPSFKARAAAANP